MILHFIYACGSPGLNEVINKQATLLLIHRVETPLDKNICDGKKCVVEESINGTGK